MQTNTKNEFLHTIIRALRHTFLTVIYHVIIAKIIIDHFGQKKIPELMSGASFEVLQEGSVSSKIQMKVFV